MEFHLPIQHSVEAASVFALLLFLYCLIKWKKNTVTKMTPPQPAGSWPVIGHLHLLRELPHIALGKLADKYGPIFMIKLGFQQALVISTPEMAKECLGNGDKVFVTRPQTIFTQHLAYNSAMIGFSPYGSHWREMRKIIALKLLSSHQVKMSKRAKVSEVRSAIKMIHDNYWVKRKSSTDSDTGLIDMKQWFNELTLNSIVNLVAGKSLKEYYQGEELNQCKQALRDFFKLAGTFVPGDALPCLRWLDIGGYEKAMKKVAKEIDNVAQGWLEEHKRRATSEEAMRKEDFMDVMLGSYEAGQDKPSNYEADTVIKATCMSMILAATDTTAVTLTWALSLLLNNRDALKKVQAELDTNVGKERQVNDSDLKNLVYLQAILKETMRLYPAGPLSVPREAITDCIVGGYHIPAGTQLFVNLYKIHRNPKVWPDPLEFHPERFLTAPTDNDLRGQSFELMPFGSGKRICPGISYALQIMHFSLANLLHGFEISTPSDEAIDMTEGFGLTNLKATSLDVILIPRLQDNLY